MILVPRQLRRSDFPSSVPYYGGRLTPRMIAGIERGGAGRPAPPGGGAPVSDVDRARKLATLDDLRADGVVTDDEYDDLRHRIVGDS
jgi:hypothetical protein